VDRVTHGDSGDRFGRFDPGKAQILTWVAIGLLLSVVARPLVVPYFAASMAIVSAYIFVRNSYSLARTLAWTIPTAALLVWSVFFEGWTEALVSYGAIATHSGFYLVPRLRSLWYGSSA
jgi:hypothetical protein